MRPWDAAFFKLSGYKEIMDMISKEQKRSNYALKQLQAFGGSGSPAVPKDVASFIVGTPTMILQNGLGQTMAFLLAKCDGTIQASNKHYFTFQAIIGWSNAVNSNIPCDHMGFFNAVSNLHQSEYLTLQEEALKMLQWLKRYARAFQQGE